MLLFKYFLLIIVFVSAILLRKKMIEHTLGAIHRGALSLNDRIEGWLKRQAETHPSSPYAQITVQQRFKKAEMWRNLYKKWRKEGDKKPQGSFDPSDDDGGPPPEEPRPPKNGGGPPPGWMGAPSYRVPPGGPPGWMGAPTPFYWGTEGEQHGGPPDDEPFGPPEIAVRVGSSGEARQVSDGYRVNGGEVAEQPKDAPAGVSTPEGLKESPAGNGYRTDSGQAAGQPQDAPLRAPAFGKLKEGSAAPEGREKGDRVTDHGPQNPAGPAAQPRAEGPNPPARTARPVTGDGGGLPEGSEARTTAPMVRPKHTGPRYPEDWNSLQTGNGAGGLAGTPGGHGHQVETAGPAPRPGADPPARAGLHQAAGANARPEGAATAAAPPPPRRAPKGAESGPGGPPTAISSSRKVQDGGGRPVAPADSARGPGPPARLGRLAGADAQGPPENPLPPLKFKLVSGRRLKMKTEHNSG